MANTITLMTALVPTLGHKYLIDFAAHLASNSNGTAHIIVGTMEKEPIRGNWRCYAIEEYAKKLRLIGLKITIHHLNRDVPQEPDEHPDFWNEWKNIVREFVDVKPEDYFVASEPYGMNMAEVLGCSFMPANQYREVVPIKGSDVRKDLLGNFDKIMPEFQPYLRKVVTIFGAESCGKTTMAKRLAKDLNGWFIPEWAREYLETVGPEVTKEKMAAIVKGQAAAQDVAWHNLHNKAWIFQDTDLYSTAYYYKLWNNNIPENVLKCAKDAQSDMYILMNDKIPFEQDLLRYGGNKRESTVHFWEDALKTENCKFYKVKSTHREDQVKEVKDFLVQWYMLEHKDIINYVRQQQVCNYRRAILRAQIFCVVCHNKYT